MTDYVQVPVEPTEDQLEAGMKAFRYSTEWRMSEWVADMYHAMLAAAPHPAAAERIRELDDRLNTAVAERVQIVQNHRESMALLAEKCGIEFFGDDTPNHVAERIAELEAGLQQAIKQLDMMARNGDSIAPASLRATLRMLVKGERG